MRSGCNPWTAGLRRRYHSIKEHRTSGFTLVELIVVLVVLGILCTLAVMGVLGWQDYADFRQNNEAAKSIFTAAQIQLTQYGERGQLTALKNEITNDGKETIGYLIGEMGIDDPEWKADEEGNQSQISAVYYLKAEKGDYRLYQEKLKGRTTAELRALAENDPGTLVRYRRLKALFDMLDPYMADKSILDAAICVEFDPNPKVAQVYSVFYNPKLQGFTYVFSEAGNRFASIGQEDRSPEARKKRQIGYYGAQILSVGTDNDLGRPVINKVSLNNENTLNLSWSVSSEPADALERLIYSLDIYRVETEQLPSGEIKEKEERIAKITLGSADRQTLDIQDAGNGYYYVNGIYEVLKSKDAEGMEHWETVSDGEGTDTMHFPIMIDRSANTISLVLDAIDVSADERAGRKTLFDSASIERLQLDAEQICVYVSGNRPGVYEATKTKRSNVEHQYFGLFRDENKDGAEIRTCTILNTRQFYNIRYYEKKNPASASGNRKIEYRLLTDLDWSVTLNSGTVYRGAVAPAAPETLGGLSETDRVRINFRPILCLGADSKLMTTESGAAHRLKNFHLDLANVPTIEEGSRIPSHTVGLFVVNEGHIENLILEAVQVQGAVPGSAAAMPDRQNGATGAFCGWNRGSLAKLTVQSGNISGDVHVGGIAGAVDTGLTGRLSGVQIMLSDLTNRGTVSGNQAVGGITGSLVAQERGITVERCANYGAVTGQNNLGPDAYYIGGIAGYTEVVERAGGVGTPSLVLDTCTSSPVYEKEYIDAVIQDIDTCIQSGTEPTMLSGIYVGGIVGLNRGGTIENCDTLRETVSDKGYVIGKRYVGGIAGFNEGNAGIVGGIRGRNQAQVIGYDYVGGIVGCNAKGAWDAGSREARILTKTEANALDGKPADAPEDVFISNWINEGTILAAGRYAGGITGFNYGYVRGCNSNVDYSDDVKDMVRVTTNARYAGGIVGYNAGLIDARLTDASDTTLAAVSVISGDSFVGGIVGYNDVGGQIRHYELRGGYIQGRRFVGGLIGLNADASVFDNRVYCNPNEITGDYFTGGIIGANLVPTNRNITAQFKADNFLGSLRADRGAFASGYIGYNYLLTAGADAEVIRQAVNGLCEPGVLPVITETDSAEEISDKLQGLEEPLKNLLPAFANRTNTMTIMGEVLEDAEQDTQVRLGGVTALVYVGGVVGYNQETTILNIRNVENITPVEATAYIQREESGSVTTADGTVNTVTIGADLEGGEKRYAYAGGIIGKVARNVTLENCKNRDVGEVRSQGTYTGGLAEINEGKITNCVAGSLGDGTRDYIGGLAGVNLGVVDDCTVVGTIMGKSRIGGLVSENYGTIRNASVGTGGNSCYIEASGQDIGGVAGYGYAGSSLVWDQDAVIDIQINSSGSRVGGAIGTNEGTIRAARTADDSDHVIQNREDNSVIGRNYVGGFIGVQKGQAVLEGMQNHAAVQAEQGFAGGIVAWIFGNASDGADKDETSVIRKCVNYGTISVLSENEDDEIELFPGGMTPEGDEDEIMNEDDDLAASVAGGIVAVNDGRITECVNHGIVEGGNGFGGGIAGLNYNQISWSSVSGADQGRLGLNGDRYVGGITAKNKPDAVIENCAVFRLELQNQTFTAEGYMGGVAGENLGRIENCSVGVEWKPEEKLSAKQEYENWHQDATVAVMNAVEKAAAGTEDGKYTLEDDPNAVILISNAPDAALGGVAGINRYPQEASSNDRNGTIVGIKEGKDNDEAYTVVLAELRFAEQTMSYYGNMGGIAGINQGEILHYEFNGLVHGTANDPAHAPEYSPNYDYEQGNHPIYGYGGIAGLNGDDRAADDAKISHCLVNMARINGIGTATNRTNVGGVAGVNGADADIRHILFGDKAELEPMKTDVTKFFTAILDGKSYLGMVWVGTDNHSGVGHVGGVAGYNQGTISYINDWKQYEGNRESYFTEKGYATGSFDTAKTDDTAVIVYSTGHTGGITGYNRRTGQIRNVVTGRNWVVGAAKQEQDNGTGGIIGYNVSEQNIEACDNHATVVKNTGNSVGGIVGRNETATSNSWRVYNCRNYGTIQAQARGAGIIGHWKYKGGTIENCANYGAVTSTGDACGGIVAMVYGLNQGETINFVDCRNFGNVGNMFSNIPSGGILGQIDYENHSGRNINLYNCVNTGLIGGNADSGGLVALARTARTSFYQCRNYGYSMRGINGNFGGIYGSGNNVSMKDTFGVTDRDESGYPIRSGNLSSVSGAYYFADGGVSADTFFYVRKIAAERKDGAWGNIGNLKYVVSAKDTGASAGNFYFDNATSLSRSGSYKIEFNRPVDLDSIYLSWFRDAATASERTFRFYKYDLVFYDENDDELTSIAVDEREKYEDTQKTPDGIIKDNELHELKEKVYKLEIRNVMAFRDSEAKANAALVEFSAKAKFEGYEEPVACALLSANTGSSTGSSESKGATYERDGDLLPPTMVEQQKEDAQYGIPLYVAQKGDTYRASNVVAQVSIEDLGANNSLEKLLLKDNWATRTTDSLLAYGIYLSVDRYLVLENSIEELATPVVQDGSAQGGYYRIPWKGDTQAQYYQVEYVYYTKDDSGKLIDLGEKNEDGTVSWNQYTVYTTALDVLADYSYGGVKADGVKVRVRAGARTTAGNTIVSEWSDERAVAFGITLPTPLVHWELVTLGSDQCYRIVLDNRQDYVQLKESWPELDLNAITIYTWTLKGTTKENVTSFNVGEGALLDQNGAYELIRGYDGSNRYLVAYADTTAAGFDRSADTIREAQLPAKDQYASGTGTGSLMANAKIESSSETGFFGDTMTSLYYQTTLTAVGEWVVNYRTELVATNRELGIPIAYAFSPATRTSPQGTTTSEIMLNGLPNDFLNRVSEAADAEYLYDQVYVRMYPTKMSNDIFYQGWQVKLPDGRMTMSLEELSELRVTADGLVDIKNGDALIENKGDKSSLKSGYVIEHVGKDEYTLYYNTLLREMMSATNDGTKKEGAWWYSYDKTDDTYRYQQVIYHEVDLKKELEGKGIQPEPIAYVNARTSQDSEGVWFWEDGDYRSEDTFVLSWDQKQMDDTHPAYGTAANQYKIGAEYLLSVEGISRVTGTDGQVTERATPLATNVSFTTKDTAGYNTWTANSTNWAYDLIRVSLTRLGETGTSGITNKFPATFTKDYPLKKRLSTIGKPVITNKTTGGEIQKDELEYVISWTSIDKMELSEQEKENQQAAFAHYEVVVTGQTSGTVYKAHTTEQDITVSSLELDFSDPVETETGEQYFYQGEKISITVSSIAKAESDTYRSGIVSAALETNIPVRLETPDMGKEGAADANMTAEIPELLSVEAFEKGCITLRMKRKAGVKYQIALQVFEDKAAAEDGSAPITEILGLPEKSNENRIYMYEEGEACSYVVSGIPAKYAGKYLKVVLRGVSDSSISSLWTDEDREMTYVDGTGEHVHSKVEPYRLFVLPTVKVNSVEIREPLGTETIDYRLLKNGAEESEYRVKATQTALTFTTVDYAADYRILIVQTPQTAERTTTPSNADMVVSDVIQMTLCRDEDGTGYTLEYQSSELADRIADAGEDGTKDSQSIDIPVGKDPVALPYEKVLPIVENEAGRYTLCVKSSLGARLLPESGQIEFTLILPDIEQLKEVDGQEISLTDVDTDYTEQVLIQSLTEGWETQEEQEIYHASDWAIAARVGGGKESALRVIPNAIPTPEMAEDGANEPNNDAGIGGAKEVERYGFAYELNENFRGNTRYLVQVTDSDGNILGIYGVPFDKQTSTSVYNANVWFPVELAKDVEQEVTLRFASIFSVTGGGENKYKGGGLSAFSDEAYQVTLPAVDPVEGVTLTQYPSDPIICEATVKGRARSVLTRQVTAKQTQMEWKYRYTDTKVNGYELTIQGANMASDYGLELDLNRDAFGQFAGLREYMVPEGKVLYSVAYDLQGDMIPFISEVTTASPSDAEPNLATGSNAIPTVATPSIATLATPSVADQAGILILHCRLRVEPEKDGLKFILILPDAAIGQLKGSAAEQYQSSEYYYDGGLYHTERISVHPLVVNPYYELPEPEWAAILRSYREDEEEGGGQEEDSSDGALRDDLN